MVEAVSLFWSETRETLSVAFGVTEKYVKMPGPFLLHFLQNRVRLKVTLPKN